VVRSLIRLSLFVFLEADDREVGVAISDLQGHFFTVSIGKGDRAVEGCSGFDLLVGGTVDGLDRAAK
jgi:hypothetical protein